MKRKGEPKNPEAELALQADIAHETEFQYQEELNREDAIRVGIDALTVAELLEAKGKITNGIFKRGQSLLLFSSDKNKPSKRLFYTDETFNSKTGKDLIGLFNDKITNTAEKQQATAQKQCKACDSKIKVKQNEMVNLFQKQANRMSAFSGFLGFFKRYFEGAQTRKTWILRIKLKQLRCKFLN